MRRSRLPIAAAVGAAAVLVLAGCGGDGAQADPEPIIPSSSSADPSPTEPSESEGIDEAPVMPEAAKKRTAEGVEAFLGYWGEVLTYTYNTGNTDPWDAISAGECESCSVTTSLVADVYGSGGSMSSDGWATKQVVFGPFIVQPLAKFDRGREVTRANSEPVRNYPAAVTTVSFDLEWAAGAWTVREFALRG